MSEVKFLTKQVSFRQSADGFSMVITARSESWKEAPLVAWVVAWTVCGVFFFRELFAGHPRETNMAIVVMLFFWLYFEIKMVRAMLWRLWGYEQLRFSAGQFSIKNSIKGYGKRHDFFTDNIYRFERVEMAGRNFLAFMENSFWIVGGEQIYFEYQGRKVALGRQLDEETQSKVLTLLNQQLVRWKK